MAKHLLSGPHFSHTFPRRGCRTGPCRLGRGSRADPRSGGRARDHRAGRQLLSPALKSCASSDTQPTLGSRGAQATGHLWMAPRRLTDVTHPAESAPTGRGHQVRSTYGPPGIEYVAALHDLGGRASRLRRLQGFGVPRRLCACAVDAGLGGEAAEQAPGGGAVEGSAAGGGEDRPGGAVADGVLEGVLDVGGQGVLAWRPPSRRMRSTRWPRSWPRSSMRASRALLIPSPSGTSWLTRATDRGSGRERRRAGRGSPGGSARWS